MGKKSVLDSSFMESAFENTNGPYESEARDVSPVNEGEDQQALLLLIRMLKSAQQKREQTLDMSVYHHY